MTQAQTVKVHEFSLQSHRVEGENTRCSLAPMECVYTHIHTNADTCTPNPTVSKWNKWFPETCVCTCVCVVCCSYHNKTPQTIWLRQQEFIFSQSGRLTTGCSTVGSGEGHLPACRWLPLFVFLLGVGCPPIRRVLLPFQDPVINIYLIPVTSQRPRLQISSHWRSDLQHMKLTGASQSSTLYIQEHLEDINRKRSNNICYQNIFAAVIYL